MEQTAAFILGLLSSAAALTSMQLKNMRLVLICQIICNGTGAFSYILTGGLSGCGIYLVAILQCVIYFVLRSKNRKTPKFLAVAFAFCYLICSAFTYKVVLDIVPALAALTCAFGVAQENASKYRLLILCNGIIWLIYDLLLPATVTMTFSHIITIIAALVGIIRLDLIHKEASETE